MSISKEQWTAIEKELAGTFGQCKFVVDGHEILVRREGVAEDKRWLVVYIGGTFVAGWGWPELEQFKPVTERVWRRRCYATYKQKRKAAIIKALGKRRAKEIYGNLDEVSVHFYPCFPKANTLVRQLKRIPEGDIQLVHIGYPPKADA